VKCPKNKTSAQRFRGFISLTKQSRCQSVEPPSGCSADECPLGGNPAFRFPSDGEGHPRFIWRTTNVTIRPLSQVDEAFAWDEGEGDRTRDWWLDAHRHYSARQASREGFELNDEILTLFERFEVVWPLDIADVTVFR
jgi:uncharacterized protein YhfF